MRLPVDLNASQEARLQSMLLHGTPNLVVVDQQVGSQRIYVLVATGEARTWVQSTLTPEAPTTEPPPAPQDPPAKVVAVSTGEHAANPPASRPDPLPRGLGDAENERTAP